MLTKFDVRSCRVKGISFHKTRPWVLCGLHNGAVQIWDYRMNTSIDTYMEHNGSVRGVDFHISQPLFVSGADDYLIKVWNYKHRRCLFTLKGHMDYIRVVVFHHEQPWILSCSDDFTVRLWNWQSRSSIATLPGHNHYVMCAQFHPREDLVVSASLDRTIRVWDISSLRLRKQEAGIAQDLLGTSDVVLKFLLEGHEKGVNWVCFHPTKPYIASAADDRTVRVWRMTDSVCHEEVQLRGHLNNVCCVTYMRDMLISNGEDRTVRVWDVKTRNPLMVFRRDSDRYWILATLPEKNLIAAGHDSGMQVFKLFRERPAWVVNGKTLHFVFENTLYSRDMESNSEYKFNLSPHLYPPTSISCNPVDNLAVLWYTNDGGVAEILTIPKPGYAVDADVKKRSAVTDAVFFAPNKYAFLDKNGKLFVCNCQGDREKAVTPEHCCKHIFPGPMGSIICQSDDMVELYHMAQNGVTAEAVVPGVKYVTWSKDYNKVALIAKNAITVMTKRFKLITTVTESTVRMKSAAFDEQRDILYYTTANHLKYCNLRNGECSTIQTMSPAYLVRACGDTVWFITRDGKVVSRELENLELNFKLKLQQHQYREVIKIIQRKQLKGQALVGYLHKHGHSEIALHFVSEPLTRFNLAVECGALDIAKATAIELNQAAVWRRLAETATKYGDIQLAQFANAKSGNFHGAGLLSLITGNMAALGHLVDTTKDDNFKLHCGLYLQDIQQRVRILAGAGQLPLAYLSAKSSGLDDMAETLLSKMEPDVADRMRATRVNRAPEPTHPTAVTDNWPMLQVEESVFARLLKEPGQFNALGGDGEGEEEEEAQGGAGWDDDEDAGVGENGLDDADSNAGGDGADADGGGWDDDLNIEVPVERVEGAGKGAYVVPAELPPLPRHWVDHYSQPAFHVAAGSFASAMDLLRRQIGLADPKPLKPYVMNLWTAVNATRPAWMAPSAMFPLTTFAPEDQRGAHHAPKLPDYIQLLTEKLRAGYAAFVEGRFADAHQQFIGIMHQAVFAVYKDDKERAALLELMTIAPEYTRALNVQLRCRSIDGNSDEALALSLYFTHYKLQRTHLTLALSQAMSKAYKKKNIKTAASLARRLLDQDPPKPKANQAAAIVAEGDRNPTDAVSVEYDERNPFVLCSVSFKPMFKGTVDPIRCSYCHSPAHPNFKGNLCTVCKIALLGAESAGLVNRI